MNPTDVFINCPFSDDYLDFFRATVFTVIRSGFTVRCALETDNGAEVRYEKICGIIRACSLGIHDISKTELDVASGLPRFNMPFELGLFLGAGKFGQGRTRNKKALILDREPYRYQKFLSDIGGQDVHSHAGSIDELIKLVATWLRTQRPTTPVPGGMRIATDFHRFIADVPSICATKQLDTREISYGDYAYMAAYWIASGHADRHA